MHCSRAPTEAAEGYLDDDEGGQGNEERAPALTPHCKRLSIDECGERRPDDYPPPASSASLAGSVPRAARHRSSARTEAGLATASDGCHGHLPEGYWLQGLLPAVPGRVG